MALSSKAYTTIKVVIDNPETTDSQLERYVTYVRRDEIPEAISLIDDLAMRNEQRVAAAEELGLDPDIFIARNSSLYKFRKLLRGLICKSVA